MIDAVAGASTNPLSSLIAASSTQQETNVAVLKKAMDNQQAQGEAALKLIDSAGQSGHIDVYA